MTSLVFPSITFPGDSCFEWDIYIVVTISYYDITFLWLYFFLSCKIYNSAFKTWLKLMLSNYFLFSSLSLILLIWGCDVWKQEHICTTFCSVFYLLIFSSLFSSSAFFSFKIHLLCVSLKTLCITHGRLHICDAK